MDTERRIELLKNALEHCAGEAEAAMKNNAYSTLVDYAKELVDLNAWIVELEREQRALGDA